MLIYVKIDWSNDTLPGYQGGSAYSTPSGAPGLTADQTRVRQIWLQFFGISLYLFELVIVDGEELEAGAVLQHLQPLAQPVLTDVQLGEARQLGEQLDICEARVFQVKLLQFDKLVGQALRLKIHQILS